ncbi:hypothetical protein H8B02_16790 [Bradyrhizobium sp. Pear77]|uniref:hypothetical protein n=1 Tax=Bradyrhizobium altum TaxID=1571202 RepID=UPI001E5201B8|nr:hypothetical protein [Bradyrhizobium altum]MCC8955036.1 hypothetical protein [Bradyrhizobium altum]
MPPADERKSISALQFLRAALKENPTPADADFLASIVKVRAVLAAKTDVDAAFLPDPVRAGYLERSIDGITVYVPFNLVSLFRKTTCTIS